MALALSIISLSVGLAKIEFLLSKVIKIFESLLCTVNWARHCRSSKADIIVSFSYFPLFQQRDQPVSRLCFAPDHTPGLFLSAQSVASNHPSMAEKGAAFREVKYLVQHLYSVGGAEGKFESQSLSSLSLSIVSLEGRAGWFDTELYLRPGSLKP